MKQTQWATPQPPVDPLDLYNAASVSPLHKAPLIGPYWTPPVIEALKDTIPHLYEFATHCKLGLLLPEQVAALFCARRLFGAQWANYYESASALHPYTRRAVDEHAMEPIGALGIFSVMRTFRVFTGRPLEATAAQICAHVGPQIAMFRGGLGRDCLMSPSQRDAYRCAMFWVALSASCEVAPEERDAFLGICNAASLQSTQHQKGELRSLFSASRKADFAPVVRGALASFVVRKGKK